MFLTTTNLQVTYRPRHPDESSWGCAVTAFGHGLIPAGQPYPPEGHPPDHAFTWENGRRLEGFQLIYLSKGKGEFESEKSALENIGSGSMLILFPGIWHRYRPDFATGWEEWWVEFSGPVPNQLLAEKLLDPAKPHYRIGEQPDIRRLLMECTRPPSPDRPDAPGQRPTLTLRLLSRLQALSNEQDPLDLVSARVHESALYLRRHYHEKVDLEQLSQNMGMSYTIWRRRFKEIMGSAPGQFILDCRMHSARNLLTNSNRRINEIAETCGFASPQHFSRLFQKKNGCSPATFRKTPMPITELKT